MSFSSVVETGLDRLQYFGKRSEIPLVCRDSANGLPDTRYRRELLTVRRREQQSQYAAALAQQGVVVRALSNTTATPC